MKLDWGFDCAAYMAAAFAPTLALGLLFIYFLEGRYSGYYPTISETGLEYPNNCFMVTFFTAIGASSFHNLYCFEMFLSTFYFPQLFEDDNPIQNSQHKKYTSLSHFCVKVFPYMSSVFFVLISVFPMDTCPFLHFFSTFIAFSEFAIFQFITCILTFLGKTKAGIPKSSLQITIFRIICVIAQVLSLITCAISEAFWSHRINITIQTIGEYVIIASITVFHLSYLNLLSNVEVYFE